MNLWQMCFTMVLKSGSIKVEVMVIAAGRPHLASMLLCVMDWVFHGVLLRADARP